MNTFEKMLFLKSTALFRYVKDDALLQVAQVLKEEIVKSGQIIIEKGTLGNVMYMIVTGKVKVYDENLLLKELGEYEVFGELSALSPQKRIASVSAIDETLLLKIGTTEIYDVMQNQIELAKGIIEALCIRAGSIASDLTQAIYHRL